MKLMYVQVGVSALRDEQGNFLPSEPIYKRVQVPDGYEHPLVESERNLIKSISGFFYDKCQIELEVTHNGIQKKKSPVSFGEDRELSGVSTNIIRN